VKSTFGLEIPRFYFWELTHTYSYCMEVYWFWDVTGQSSGLRHPEVGLWNPWCNMDDEGAELGWVNLESWDLLLEVPALMWKSYVQYFLISRKKLTPTYSHRNLSDQPDGCPRSSSKLAQPRSSFNLSGTCRCVCRVMKLLGASYASSTSSQVTHVTLHHEIISESLPLVFTGAIGFPRLPS